MNKGHVHTALTNVGGRCVFVGMQVELPGSHGVHLDKGDAPTAPLPLRLVDGEKGLEEQIDNAFGNRMGIDSQTGQQVVHVAHVPELESGTRETSFSHLALTCHPVSGSCLKCNLAELHLELYQTLKYIISKN